MTRSGIMWKLVRSSTYIVAHVYAGLIDECWVYNTLEDAWAGMDTHFNEEINNRNEWDSIDDYNENSYNQLTILESSN